MQRCCFSQNIDNSEAIDQSDNANLSIGNGYHVRYLLNINFNGEASGRRCMLVFVKSS